MWWGGFEYKMFEADPYYEKNTECDVKETFVGDREEDKGGREGEEDDYEAVDVVCVRPQETV